MSWRTNRKTKKPFPNPLGSDLDRGRSRVEETEEQPSEVESDVSSYEVNGHRVCQQCMSDYRSGRMQAEENYLRAQDVMSYPSSPTGDSEHTHMGICSVCSAPHQRNLCSDGHNACFSCRPPGCRFKR
jgi:hypothetical protein